MYKISRVSVIILGGSVLLLPLARNFAGEVGFFPQTTYKVVQLTGDIDHPRRIPTLSRTYANECVFGTDLGSTFEHNGHLHFLFGDTPALLGGDNFDDFLAWTDAVQPEDLFLNVHHDGGGCVHQLNVPGVVMGCCEVPSYGISLHGQIYIVVTTREDAAANCSNGCLMDKSVLAVSYDNGFSFQQLYDFSTMSRGGQFINVSLAQVDGRQFPSLPPEQCVLIWGSGRYRGSDVYLAYVPSAQITNRSAIRYLSGVFSGTPLWDSNETNAVSLFNPPQPQVGELSVQWCQQLGKWILLYGSGDYGGLKGGIHMRSASVPWGEWSQPVVIFDAWRDNAFARYIHLVPGWGGQPNWDVFSDRPDSYDASMGGAPYGPYLIPRFFKGNQNRVTIVYTMSTANPYQAVLMQSDIGYPDLVHENITSATTLPGDISAGWLVSGNFLRNFTRDGVPYVTTSANNGDADMGVAQYGFFAGCSDQALEFNVHGGDAEVVLIEQTRDVPPMISDVPGFYTALKRGDYGRVVECMVGPQNNFVGVPDLKVRWDLRRHRGKTMRLFVIDWLNQPWGFISVSQITHFFVDRTEPVNVYVNRANGSGPFLGTPDYPFPTVTAGYNAATDSACAVSILKIRAGSYAETVTMNRAVILNAEGGAVTVGH